ncbi:MAG TPA: protein-L-isoaspartate(D-aspartate) O-methyltransferase [Planctomycetota bacterium]|nr:protein-L-isoaspartate(D-aspartate) O-methyltransferase [Planctomycetota bacterium]
MTAYFPEDAFAESRRRMVDRQLAGHGIRDERVLEVMRRVPRHGFIPETLVRQAYEDHPVAIGGGQTISQPYMVARMTESLGLRGGEKVLEIGSGSGYQTAVLKALRADVYTVERVPELSERARENVERAGFLGVHYRVGDGSRGWPEEAPFDRVIVTAGAPTMPVSLVEQLREGGSMVIPVGGEDEQELLLVRRGQGRVTRERICACVFVKLWGEEGW